MGAATVRVGLAGCGVVGGALVRLLDESADTIESRYGVRLELSGEWSVFTATRRELTERVDGDEVAVARLGLPVIPADAS